MEKNTKVIDVNETVEAEVMEDKKFIDKAWNVVKTKGPKALAYVAGLGVAGFVGYRVGINANLNVCDVPAEEIGEAVLEVVDF